MSTASKVAEDKLNHPWKFCPANRCLWKTGDGSYCPKHKTPCCQGWVTHDITCSQYGKTKV